MNKPAQLMMNNAVESLLDRVPNPCVGEELNRVEGPLKVSGKATYAAEYKFDKDVLHGFLVSASIAKGTVESIDENSEGRSRAGGSQQRRRAVWRRDQPQGRDHSPGT